MTEQLVTHEEWKALRAKMTEEQWWAAQKAALAAGRGDALGLVNDVLLVAKK